MNENIQLEDEELFLANLDYRNREQIIKKYKQRGINTIGDFINTDISDLTKRHHEFTKYVIKTSYKMLKYKYQGKRMAEDVYLDETIKEDDFYIHSSDGSIEYDCQKIYNLLSLGFIHSSYSANKFLEEIYNEIKGKEISAIEIIKRIIEDRKDRIGSPSNAEIGKFYLDYYKKEFMNSKDSVETLTSLKKELSDLLTEREMLDSRISQLTDQINSLEGGNITNGRK